MSKPKYFGPDGRPCQLVEWQRLKSDPANRFVCQFDDGRIYIAIEWLGVVTKPDDVFPGCYELFKASVFNYNEMGRMVPDPVEDDRTFDTLDAAKRFYSDFLIRWSESTVDENGKLQEAENKHTPPDPNKPAGDYSAVTTAGAEIEGGW